MSTMPFQSRLTNMFFYFCMKNSSPEGKKTELYKRMLNNKRAASRGESTMYDAVARRWHADQSKSPLEVLWKHLNGADEGEAPSLKSIKAAFA